MGLCGGGGTDDRASNQQGKIAQEQWQDYMSRYVPLENELMGYTNTGTSVLSGAETSTTPVTGEEMDQWSFTTEGTYSGKDKWLRKEDKLEAKIARMEAKGKTGKKYKKRLKKLQGLRDKIGAHTTEGQTFSGEKMSLAGQLNKADQYSASASEAQHGQGLRDAARYGGMTDSQKQYYDRKAKLGATKNRMTLRNATRDFARDRSMNLTGEMIGVGRGLSNAAQQGMGAAAGMANQRNAQNMQSASAARGQLLSTAGMAASMFFMSTAKVKENIEAAQVDDLVAKLNSVDLYKFNYKGGNDLPTGDFYGPIIELLPDEFVQGDHLNTYNILGALMATVQSLQARIDELENKE